MRMRNRVGIRQEEATADIGEGTVDRRGIERACVVQDAPTKRCGQVGFFAKNAVFVNWREPVCLVIKFACRFFLCGGTLAAMMTKTLPFRPPVGSAIVVAPQLIEAAGGSAAEAIARLSTMPQGLTQAEAEARLTKYGPNVAVSESRSGRWGLLLHGILNPLVILLLVLAAISAGTGDARAAAVMVAMVVLGVVLRFVQESKADEAAAKLKAMIRVTATVLRDGSPREVPLADLVPGDVVQLAAGDMIPADLRILGCKDLHIIQGSLTGEAFPVEKADAPESLEGRTPLELRNVCFLGTSVESGSAQALVVATGKSTYLGTMADAIVQAAPETSFDRGIKQFTWLMIRFIFVMVPLVFVINGFTKKDWGEAFFFAVAVAVGLTPEMLPMIVAVCLSRGAIAMSRRKVIVKRLNSIQNLGAMDVLCTDKTGTLTMDCIILEKHCNVVLEESDDVLLLAYLNSFFQTGLRNLMDRAILAHRADLHEQQRVDEYRKADEIPFDFVRKVMSVVVQTPDGKNRLICKGAPEEILKRCTRFEVDDQHFPIEHMFIEELKQEYEDLSVQGFRVLALAYRDLDPRPAYGTADECDLTLKGYVAFLDPPKESAAPALQALRDHGVSVKVLTGDNELVSKTVCKQVGIDAEKMLLGRDIEAMDDEKLAASVEECILFARLSPAHKQRIIRALQAKGHVVGFMGDGINDAPALRAADVGISVDTAVDIAKESADAILLEKSLMVLEGGVVDGRKVFANILKYIRMGASSNFGNMFSVLGASIFLPFVPMAPIQILTNNLLYDLSQVPIPTDDVDPEQIKKPRPWSIGQITRFILFIGPCSSIFDYATFFLMLYAFGCWDPAKAHLFQTGWFVESLLTQTLIIHVIRTNRIPFLESRASWPLIATTASIMLLGIWLPSSSLGPMLNFEPLPALYWPWIGLMLVAYLGLTQMVKTWLFRRGWV
jgi:Mg2+-importing ATPase